MSTNNTFESFIVSECNKKAFEICDSFAREELKGCLVSLYGPRMCGKTHLIEAIENRTKMLCPGKKTGYLQYYKISDDISASFLDLYYDELCNCDLLIIDELERVKCKTFFQRVFAKIASNVLKKGGNVIVAHNCPAGNLKTFFDNVYFASGTHTVEMKYPDINLMREYIKAKQEEYGVELSASKKEELIRSRWLGILAFFCDVSRKCTVPKLLALIDEMSVESD